MSLTDKLLLIPAGLGPWTIALLCGAAGAALGWRCGGMATRLADAPAWPRSLSALVTGLLFVLHTLFRAGTMPAGAGWAFAAVSLFLIELAVVACLVLIVQVDLASRLIPNELVLGLMCAGVAGAVIDPATAANRFLGLAVVGGIMLVVGVAGRGALGAGDVKLLAAAGLLLGWQAGIVAFLASFTYAALISLALMALRRRRRRDMIPFAPFISAGIWTAMLVGGEALALIWPFLATAP